MKIHASLSGLFLSVTIPILPPCAFSQTAVSPAAAATKSTLAQEMEELTSGDKVASPERLYIVQDRTVGLAERFEISVGAAKNFNSNIYINSTETSGLLTYHFNDRWYTSLYGAYVSNDLTKSGQDAWTKDGIYPNTAFVKRRYDGTVGFNLIYGKARVTQDAMFYFDQYVALGGGVVYQDDGQEEVQKPSAVADIGFALWFGKRLTFRLGVKDHYFEEKRPLDASRVHHVLGYSTLGFLLGGAG